MMQAKAIVVAVGQDEILLETLEHAGCGNCSAKTGCGTIKISSLFAGNSRQLRVRKEINVVAGDHVLVEIPDGKFFSSVLLVYVLPLLCLFVGAIAGASVSVNGLDSDLVAAAGAGAGLILGYVVAGATLKFKKSATAILPRVVILDGK